MNDETIASATPVEGTVIPAVACCAQSDASTRKACTLCQQGICKRCRRFVNGKSVCGTCADQIAAEIEAERAGAARLPAAMVAGAVAALVGGGIWALIGIMAKLEVGYVAIGVGWLAGTAVVIGAGRKKGPPLQVIAVVCAIFGLVVGKYLLLVHAIKTVVAKQAGQEAADQISYVGSRTIELFFELLPKLVSVFDALWLVLALGIAWRIPKATEVHMSAPRG